MHVAILVVGMTRARIGETQQGQSSPLRPPGLLSRRAPGILAPGGGSRTRHFAGEAKMLHRQSRNPSRQLTQIRSKSCATRNPRPDATCARMMLVLVAVRLKIGRQHEFRWCKKEASPERISGRARDGNRAAGR